ncbi:hypothetical protein GIB23_04625 [Pseudomonas putida]|nr:hypothetical protein [Pseudomonas putida]
MTAITTTEYFTLSELELMTRAEEFIKSTATQNLHIVAGHFMLFHDKIDNRLIPGIFEDIINPELSAQVRARVGIFPTYSWQLGIKLAEHHITTSQKCANLILLINDWQYVSNGGDNNCYRASFYEKFETLPPSYQESLSSSEVLSTANVTPSRKHPMCYPETWLKNRFQNEAERLVKQGKLQKNSIAAQPELSEISFTDACGTCLPLVSCGMTGCAGEITELISEAYRAGARTLIILAPSECHTPIRMGVEIALTLYDLDPMSVMVADLGGNGELTPEEIYSKGSHIVTYRT